MKARQYDRRILTRGIEPNVYAVQESNGINRDQLKYFGTGLTDTEKNTAVSQMEGLLNTLNDAKEYGSLVNVEDFDWELLEKFAENTDIESQISFHTYGLDETAEQLRRLTRIGKVMAQKYEVVVTNPPYAGTSNLSAKVNNFVKKNYPDSKADLFAVFIERCGEMLKKNGYQAMITMHSWMFLSSFEKLRVKLQQQTIVNMAHLGARAFEEIGGEVVQTTSFVLSKKHEDKYVGIYCRLVEPNNQAEKENSFIRKEKIYRAKQNDFKKIPGSPVAYWVNEKVYHVFENGVRFKTIGDTRQGMATSDVNRFTRLWYEVDCCNIGWNYSKLDSTEDGVHTWYPYIKGGTFRKWYGNEDYLVNWKFNGKEVKEYAAKLYKSYSRTIKNISEYLKPCISWGMVTTNNLSVRYYPAGHIFDIAGCCCFSNDEVRLYLLGFLNSCIANTFCKILNPTINMNVGDIGNLPLIVSKTYKEKVDFLVERCIELAKLDWNSFETSWDFKCHPLISVISQNRTLFEDTSDIDLSECYICWENECNERFNQLKANEEDLNSIFIDIYGLQDELTPEVEDKDVTVCKADLQRDIKSQISYAVGCMFGRYSLNKEGLGYAGGEWDESIYSTFAPDRDNIIPICDEEYFSDDIVSRFCEWVKIVYGEKSLETNLDFIAKALGNKGNTSREVIRNYFLNDFFKDHCNTYSVTGSGKRPIYWLFDSGKQNGFKALIYMHRYDADTVGRVRTDYLHKAQKYVETAMQSAQYTIDNATSVSEKSKATKAVTKYTKQLAEMKIYDEAIAHVANQRIKIDLDDGVKVNYAKFQGVEVAQEGKKALKIDLLAKI